MDDRMAKFRVDLRLLSELGERLISRDEIAVVELVKNSYDADANIVEVRVEEDRIEVRDDGEGMSEYDINEGWLTIGTVVKKQRKITKSGRRVLGEKGLGRLAVLRLGKLITIYTRKSGGPCYKIVMDWGKTIAKLEREIYTPVEEMVVEFEEITGDIPLETHGTSVVIEELNSTWDEDNIKRLEVSLSRLIEPQSEGNAEFSIRFYSGGKELEIQPPEIITKPHYYMEVSIKAEGSFSGSMEWKLGNGEGKEEIKGSLTELGTRNVKRWKRIPEGGCGGFRLKLSVWDLDATELRGYKTLLRQWSGVSLFRNGFRVMQSGVTWLGLDLRRVQNPTLRLSTNQIMGSVSITTDQNPLLIDKTDREGVIENEAFDIMKATILHLMDILERKRYVLRRSKTLSRGTILSYLDTEPLRHIAGAVSQQSREEIERYASQLESFRGMLEHWMLGRDRMATMGILGARLIHEARNALARITDNYPLIEKHLDEFDPPLLKRLERMVTGGKMLAQIFNNLNPFLRFRGVRKQSTKLKEIIDSLGFLFNPELRKNNIKLENRASEDIIFAANPTDMYVMLANLLDNSIYWLTEGETAEKIIEFRAWEEGNSLIIEVADSGPGISPEIRDILFEAGSTMKQDGTGLGLSIVRDIVEFYGGEVETGEDEKLKGGLFRATLPFRER